MGNGSSSPAPDPTTGNYCDRHGRIRSIQDTNNRLSYMNTDTGPSSICNQRCRYADKWYKIRVYNRDTNEYMGNLAIYWRCRSGSQTPHSLALVDDDHAREYYPGTCYRMFWKIRRSTEYIGSGTDPRDRPYDLVNLDFVQFRSVIYRGGREAEGRNGAVTSAFCGGSQCGQGWRIPSMRLFNWTDASGDSNNVREQDRNLRFFLSNFIEVSGQQMPSKRQSAIYVVSDETRGIKRPLSNVLQTGSSCGDAYRGNYYEVGYKVSNYDDIGDRLRFEFVPYNVSGNTLSPDSDDVQFVYDMEDEYNVYFCYKQCCGKERNILTSDQSEIVLDNSDICYQVFNDYVPRFYQNTLGGSNSGLSLNQVRADFAENMCTLDPNQPRSVLNLLKPECQNLCLRTGEENFNVCRNTLESFCQSIDLNSIEDENERQQAELICACYQSPEYYREKSEQLLEGLRGTPAESYFRSAINSDLLKPYCWFGLCKDSPLNPSTTLNVPQCTPNTLNLCIQYIDVVTREGRVELSDREALNSCIINNTTGPSPSPGPSPPSPSPTPPGPSPSPSPAPRPPAPSPSNGKGSKGGKGKDKGKGTSTWIIVGAVGLTVLVLVVVVLSTTKKKK